MLKKKYMLIALKEASKNLRRMDGGPFGACIVKGNEVIGVGRNTVLKKDATCHAEINAIRQASRRAGTFDLSGSAIYSTNEPCPMCFAAIHWARIGTVVYGTSVKDARRIGFNELDIGNRELKRLGKSRVKILSGFLRTNCEKLLRDWDRLPNKELY